MNRPLAAGLAILGTIVLSSAAAAEWYFREGPTEFVQSDLAGGTGADGRSLFVYCGDGVPTVMAYGYPAEPGANRSEPLPIVVSGFAYRVDATRVPPDGILFGAAPNGLIEALRRGSQATMMPSGHRSVVDLTGSSRAITAALANCGESAAAAASASLSRAVVEARAQQQCEGTAELSPDAILETQFDGDGLPDYVLNWEAVSCSGGTFAGMRGAGHSGAGNCTIEVFASSIYDPTGRPQLISAVGFEAAAAGDPVVFRTEHTGGRCGSAEVCEAEWVWTGSALEARF